MADITPTAKIQKMGERTKRNTEIMLSYCRSDSFVVFDRESTSYQPHEHYGKIIELSAVKIVNDQIVDTFDRLVNPEIKISSKITELTGISDEMVKDAPTYHSVIMDFVKFCEGSVVVAHSAMVDINFVNFFASKMGIPFEPRYIDTINLCKYVDAYINPKEATPKYNLRDMAIKYGIDNDGHHRAMNDTIVTAKLFIKLKSILSSEISKRDMHIQEEMRLEPTKARIGSVNYWEKNINDKKIYKRVYIRLILEDKVNEVYYDFVTKSWGIKKLEFKMTDFNFMPGKLKEHLRLSDEEKALEVSTYKKG